MRRFKLGDPVICGSTIGRVCCRGRIATVIGFRSDTVIVQMQHNTERKECNWYDWRLYKKGDDPCTVTGKGESPW